MNKGEAAALVLGAGGIQFGEFKLKMHEKHPDAPLSPIYINLRIPPKGQLSPEIIRAVGWTLGEYAVAKNLISCTDCVVGLPKAGEPIAEALKEYVRIYYNRVLPLLYLEKEESDTGRKILPQVRGEYQEGWHCLMADDLITAADTKIEAASALRSNGLVVTDCLVLVDREQGGAQELIGLGINLHSLCTLGWLLEFYSASGLIEKETQQRVLGYRQAVDEYMAQQKSLGT